MTKQYVTVVLCDADDVIGSDDAVKYVRMALDYYQSQATMDLYKVRPAGPSLGEDESMIHQQRHAASPKGKPCLCDDCEVGNCDMRGEAVECSGKVTSSGTASA